MASTIPSRIIQARVYSSENMREAFVGHSTVELPSIEFLSDTVAIGGEMDVPTYGLTGSMELGLTFNTPTGDTLKLLRPGTHNLVIRAALQEHLRENGTTVVRALRVEVSGLTKSNDLGSIESSTASDTEVTIEVARLRIFLDDVKKLEIDKFNDVYEVEGIDYLSAVRAAT